MNKPLAGPNDSFTPSGQFIHDSGLPKELIVGMVRGRQWPIQVLVYETDAITWVSADPKRRQVWKVTLLNAQEMEYIAPKLVMKDR